MVNPTTVDTDPGLTIAQAADALGISVKTVRRRIRMGQLKTRTVQGRNGPEHRVDQVDRTNDHRQSDHSQRDQGHDQSHSDQGRRDRGHDQGHAPTVDISSLVALVEKLNEQLVQKSEAAAMWQTRATVLAEQIDALRDQLALPAPTEPSAPPVETPPTVVVSPVADPAQLPWWKRLFT